MARARTERKKAKKKTRAYDYTPDAATGPAPNAWALSRRYRFAPVAHATAAELESMRARPEDWSIDLAWDGHRVLATRVKTGLRVVSPDYREWSAAFPLVASALARLPLDSVVLEGHLCVMDERGHPSFARLLDPKERARAVLVVWDVLHEGGVDLASKPLAERRARLGALLAGAGAGLAVSEAVPGAVDALLEGVRSLGAPGLYARRASAAHPSPIVAVAAETRPDGTSSLAWDRTISPPPTVTNADKVLFPRDGITKREIAAFYGAIAPFILPHMRDRVVVAQRWPDGIDDFTWYQHRIPPRAPDYVKGAWIEGDRRLRVDGPESLAWLVNQAALTFHTWPSRVGSLGEPDWALLDLDPGDATRWEDTVAVALALRAMLEALELPSVLKTSGKRGLHVLLPLAPGHSVQNAHDLARGLARQLARHLPELVTLESDKEKRKGRLLADHLQSFVGKSLACVYTLRAADGAPVSTPIEWSELSSKLDPRAFNLRTIRARLDAVGDLAAPLLRGEGARAANAIQALALAER